MLARIELIHFNNVKNKYGRHLMSTSTIRSATEQDIEEMILLYMEFHAFHVRGVSDRLRTPDISDDTRLQNTLHDILQRKDAQIFVADLNGTLVGLAEVYVREDEPNPFIVTHRYGHLQSLIVTTPYRKIGLGKQLVMAAQQWAKEQKATEIQLDIWEFAEGPLHFYEALGYRTLKRHLVIDLD